MDQSAPFAQLGPLLRQFHQSVSALIPKVPDAGQRDTLNALLSTWREAVADLQQKGPGHVQAAQAEVEKLQLRNAEIMEQLLAQQAARAEQREAKAKKVPSPSPPAEPPLDLERYATIRAELLQRFGEISPTSPTRRDPGNVWEDWSWE